MLNIPRYYSYAKLAALANVVSETPLSAAACTIALTWCARTVLLRLYMWPLVAGYAWECTFQLRGIRGHVALTRMRTLGSGL